jgi:hypothetical protein
MKVKCICEECGEPFEVRPSVIKKGKGKYCSKKCSGLARRNKVKQLCPVCGKTFEVFPSDIKLGRGKYCSLKCRDFVRRTRVKRICKVCGKEFEVVPSQIKIGNGNFCSNSCAAKVSIKKRKHNAKPKKTQPELIFQELCKRNDLPFYFTGDRSLWVGVNPSLNPDFIHTNKKRKICVEVLGAWWHNSMLNQKISYERTYNGRKALLKSYGWKMIGIWDHDLKREDAEQFVLYTLAKYKIYPSTI